jgi:hypothetical protein
MLTDCFNPDKTFIKLQSQIVDNNEWSEISRSHEHRIETEHEAEAYFTLFSNLAF